VLVETVAILVSQATRRWVVLREDWCTECPPVTVQHDVMISRSDVVVVVIKIERERQQRVVAQSLITQKLLCNTQFNTVVYLQGLVSSNSYYIFVQLSSIQSLLPF